MSRSPAAPRRPRVALVIESSNGYARGLLRGVARYAHDHGPWSLSVTEQGRGEPPRWLAGWSGEGIVARIETPAIAAAVAAKGLPTVDVSAARLVPALPWVETDDAAIARLAFEHLAERGHRSLAFAGDGRFNWSRWRGAELRRLARAQRLDWAEIDLAAAPEELEPWLAALPRPTGLVAGYDAVGRRVLDACRRLALAVPEELAVLGVDDDELLCGLSDPPLSSVIPDALGAGYEAARLLHRALRGAAVAGLERRIPPRGVATRRSTDGLAIDDPDVARALHFIRERACEGIGVPDVLRAVPLSRRALEERFRELVGTSPHRRIVRERLARIRHLLATTDLPLAAIAESTGFRHVEYMSVYFKCEEGLPPSAWRARLAAAAGAGPADAAAPRP